MADVAAESHAIPLGGIIGIAAAGLALIVVVIVLLYLLCTRHVMKPKDARNPESSDVIYSEVATENRKGTVSSEYAQVEFKKSDKFKEQKKKKKFKKTSQCKEKVPIYAEIQGHQKSSNMIHSPEPAYANINIQSSV